MWKANKVVAGLEFFSRRVSNGKAKNLSFVMRGE